ncbi:mitochondrial carrier protein-like protein, partial [Pseudovirgaria hyperparasitica]
MRALTARMVAFYFRAPMKAFFRARVEYGYPRAINPYYTQTTSSRFSWRLTTPGLLTHAVRTHGWSFLPLQVLPPLLANTLVGSILYVSYLQFLGLMHDPSARSTKRAYPPAWYTHTFLAGFAAGAIQSLVAAPLDALQVRFQAKEMQQGRYKHMLHYASAKLSQIGLRGIFAGFSLSFVRDAFGAALFFSTFETVKSQAFYEFVTRFYGDRGGQARVQSAVTGDERPVIRPHYSIEPSFILAGGVLASVAQQVVVHPLGEVQGVHYARLEGLDARVREQKAGGGRQGMMRLYYKAYEQTLQQCAVEAKKAGGWRTWLYRGFAGNTLRQVPSTSAGLIVFELVRRRYATDEEAVRIEKDGYDILLT